MKIINSLKRGVIVLGSFLAIADANAAAVNIDFEGVISDAHIISVTNGVTSSLDSSLWGLGSEVATGKTISLGISYDTNAASDFHLVSGAQTLDSYYYTGFSVGASSFTAANNEGSVSMNNDYWDSLYSGFWYPNAQGLAFSFQNEIYYLLSGSLWMIDATGTVFENTSLPSEQSQLDAFWQRNTEPGAFGDHLGQFDLSFAKDPGVNTSANGVWPNGDILEVKGYFNGAKLTKTEVSEPASYFLILVGLVILSVRRTLK